MAITLWDLIMIAILILFCGLCFFFFLTTLHTVLEFADPTETGDALSRYLQRDVVELDTGWSNTLWDECAEADQGKLICYDYAFVGDAESGVMVRDYGSITEYSPSGWSAKKIVQNPFFARSWERYVFNLRYGWALITEYFT